MKKIYSIVTLMLCILFVGCSDDDNSVEDKLLRVISSDVSFNCGGGTGVINVESPMAISATSTEEWCQVAVNANVVNLTISPNLFIGSRTALVTIMSGTESTQVPVYQFGDIFDTNLKNADFIAKGGEMTFRVKSNWEVEFEGVDKSWLTCTYSAADEQVTIKATPLTGAGKYRSNTIKVKSGTHEMNITFTQANMTGKYACFVNAGRGAYGTCLIEETETDFLYKITPSGSAYDAPYYAKYRNGQFVIYFGQYLGQYQHATHPYLYLCAYDKAGYLAWGSNIEYVASAGTVNVNGDMLLIFGDNGTWSGQKVDGFYYGLFDKSLEDGGKFGQGAASVIDLIWVKIPD